MVARMRQRGTRQHCEACEVTSRSAKLIGVMLGEHDVLLCADHALLALDTDMQSLAELKELLVLLSDDTGTAASTRRSPAAPRSTTRHSAA
jgi:hypothetical protein